MNKSILVTGASKGIGSAIVQRFWNSENEIENFILLARNSSEFSTTLESLKSENPYKKNIYPYFVDLADREQLIVALESIGKRFNNIDYLINNAGFTKPESLHQVDFSDFERTMAINLYAPFTIVQELLHSGNKFEVIVNIASTAGINGRSGWLTYSASKAAMINMSEVMREELSIYDTRVVCLAPGRCATDLRKTLAPDEDPSTIMQPQDVASVVDMLFSRAGAFIDSQRLIVRL